MTDLTGPAIPARTERQKASLRAPLARRMERAAAWGASALWLVVIPGLLAGLFVRYGIPTPAEAEGSRMLSAARFAGNHRVIVVAGLFVVMSAMTRHFHGWLPATADSRKRPPAHDVRGVVVALLVAVALGLTSRFVATAYEVTSASMIPTLEPRDVIAAAHGDFTARHEGPHDLARGDVVVFQNPEPGEEHHLVKRIIGLPGDRIRMNGPHTVINGWEVPSCDAGPYFYPLSTGGGISGRLNVEFLGKAAYLTLFGFEPPWNETFDVDEDEVFVLGDNRGHSQDSRAWNGGKGGGLKATRVEGRTVAWLFGVHRNDHVDFEHALRPLDLALRLDGIDAAELREGIRQCLAHRPTQTEPPSPT